MRPDEQLCAFLDDIYVLSSPDRSVRVVGREVGQCGHQIAHRKEEVLESKRCASSQHVRTRARCVESIGRENPRDLIEEATQRRLEEERILWDAILSVPDTQCAWQILLQCAGPRCHHWLRTVPPSCSATYAVCAHGACGLLGIMGGRIAHDSRATWGSVGELKKCTRILDHAGFVGRPSWAELRRRPFASLATSLESGTTAGSTMLLPLLNTTFGRAWFYASRVPETRLMCDPTPAQVRDTCCRVHQLTIVQSVPGTLPHPRP